MAWTVIRPAKTARSRGMAEASIGYGRICLNVAACELIENYGDYKYVELLEDPNNKLNIGVRFLHDHTEAALSIKRKKQNGKTVGGVDISARNIIEQIYGNAGIAKAITKYAVTRDKDEANILVIKPK